MGIFGKPNVDELERKRDISSINQALKHDSKKIRSKAALAIANLALIGIVDRSSIPLLNNALQDNDEKVRWNTVLALNYLAEKNVADKSSIIPLNKLLQDNDRDIRFQAEIVLEKIKNALKKEAQVIGIVKCPKCGYENPIDSNYCIKCGNELDFTRIY